MRPPLAALAAVAAALVALALPATAGAHAIVTRDGDTIVYWARDATSQSTVSVTVGADRIRITDRTVDAGIDPGRCDPGEVDRYGFVVEVTCPRTAATRLRVDVGSRDDVVELREAAGAAPIDTVILGGSGADRLTGGGGGDLVDGGDGPDTLDGRGGDDELRARDGGLEVVACGDGADRAYLDLAELADGCETTEYVDPPPPAQEPRDPQAADTSPPAVEGAAPRRQRVGRSAALRVTASASEVAQVFATGRIRAGRRVLTLTSPQQRAAVPGERVELTLRATRSTARALRRAMRSRRALYATITVGAIDDAGNSRSARLPRVRLLR
jgi:hypothetical protein